MQVLHKESQIDHYIHALINEINTTASLVNNNVVVRNIHFGGGTPSILSCSQLKTIMHEINRCFHVSTDASIAMEIEPRGFKQELAKTLVTEGFNRISFGVQDFDRRVQKTINRIQSFELVSDVVSLCRNAGINSINFDLIYGLPYQTIESMEETISNVQYLSPDRIALFGYAHVPWVKPHQNTIPTESLPSPDSRYHLYQHAMTKLSLHGYNRIGIDHFAKDHDALFVAYQKRQLHRNFQGYTTDTNNTLIGMGSSSISQFKQGYSQNISKTNDYIRAVNNNQSTVYRGLSLEYDDVIRASIIEELMCYMTVDLSSITKRFKLTDNHFENELSQTKQQFNSDYVTVYGSKINVHHPLMCRLVCSVFDQYYVNNVKRHSQSI